MTEAERKVLKNKLSEESLQLEKDIEELKEMVKPIAPENAIGRISRMDAINNKSINEAALRKAETKLHAMKEALKQIENSDFGLCKRCGNTIPIGRLMLRPQTKACVSCAH